MERLAVSNIAWEPPEDDAIGVLLAREGVTGIELAPTKWRQRPYEASRDDVLAYRRQWEDRGLRVVALQALLFGRADLQLFGDDTHRAALADYLRRAIDFGSTLGAHALVFGSPKNRARGALPVADAMGIAATFFREVGEHAHERGAVLCIEANPPEYGCDFVTTTAEAIALCRLTDHPGIQLNLDLGAITLGGEDPLEIVESANGLIGHVHASEPRLAEVAGGARHETAARALQASGYRGWVSIEMRAGGENASAIERAVRAVKGAYGV